MFSECIKLRDSLLYEFGSSLMTRNSLWQIGMDYLDHCSQEGKLPRPYLNHLHLILFFVLVGQAALALLLTKIPFRTEKQALKIIGIAQKKRFFEAGKTFHIFMFSLV